MCNKNAQGFSLILVLFLLVVVSLLAAAMAQLNRGGSAAVTQEILSVRALFAAESGAQVMAMKIFPITGASACGPLALAFPANGLNGCTANVTCASVTTPGRTVFTVRSTGTCTANTERASRTIEVGLRSNP